MLSNGIVSPEAAGIGLRAAPDLCAIDALGNPVPGLWIVGPPVRGSRFEATAVPELRVMAELAASEICGRSRLADRAAAAVQKRFQDP